MPSFFLISMNQFAIKICLVGKADGALSFPASNSAFRLSNSNMVGVAQLVEPQVVALVVVGSSPITHPINKIKPGRGILPGLVFPVKHVTFNRDLY